MDWRGNWIDVILWGLIALLAAAMVAMLVNIGVGDAAWRAAQRECAAACAPAAPDVRLVGGEAECFCDARVVRP